MNERGKGGRGVVGANVHVALRVSPVVACRPMFCERLCATA